MQASLIKLFTAGLMLAFTCQAALAGAGGPEGTGNTHSLPEPASLALLGAGIAGVLALRSRRRKK